MSTPGRLALVGSGADTAPMRDVVAWLAEGRPARYVHVANAVGLDGARTLARWHETGAQTAQRTGADYVAVDVRTRDEADSADLAAAVAGAGIVVVDAESSENLVRTLAGTRVWAAVVDAWRGGASLAANGVAAMALCGAVLDARQPSRGGRPGLGLVPDLRLIPDIDGLGPAIPHSVLAPLADPCASVVGLDAGTALTGEGPADDGRWEFRARGRGSAWVIEPERRRRVLAPLRLAVRG